MQEKLQKFVLGCFKRGQNGLYCFIVKRSYLPRIDRFCVVIQGIIAVYELHDTMLCPHFPCIHSG